MLLLVLVLALLIISLLGIAVSTSLANLNSSRRFAGDSQASLAASSGLNNVITTLRNAPNFTAYPCNVSANLPTPAASAQYSSVIEYLSYGTELNCPPDSTLSGDASPTAAIITSTGSAPDGAPVVMEEDVNITGSSQSSAYDYAIFSENQVTLSAGSPVLEDSSSGQPPDVYSGTTFTCGNGLLTAGSVITYAPVSISGNCSIGGNLVEGDVPTSSGVQTIETGGNGVSAAT